MKLPVRRLEIDSMEKPRLEMERTLVSPSATGPLAPKQIFYNLKTASPPEYKSLNEAMRFAEGELYSLAESQAKASSGF